MSSDEGSDDFSLSDGGGSDDYAPKASAAAATARGGGGGKASGATKSPAKAKKSSTTAAKSKAAAKRKALADSNSMDEDDGSDRGRRDDFEDDEVDDEVEKPKPKKKASSAGGLGHGKSIEEIYQKKTQLEHILLRPDTYIGSVESSTESMWVLDAENSIVTRTINYVPGLYKIFDEILVNAADNKVRDPSMDRIDVTIDQENNMISVYNNGRGIPIEMHAKERVYVPELIFGHLLTSSNYDDSEKKVTGGRNGYGAKLCNIFSVKFIVETGDSTQGKKYKQTFSKNMSVKSEPKITSAKTEDYTMITFYPDLQKFGMTHLDNDIVSLFSKRAYDLAGCVPGIKVYLNNKRLKIKNFKEYVNMYIPEPSAPGAAKPTIVYEKVSDRWEVACFPSGGQFSQVSFVNSICTHKGGKHVDHVVDQIASAMIELVKKKDKKELSIKPHQAKAQLFVFINCLIENPAFDSQTKENMTLKISAFGSKCGITEEFNKKIARTGVVDQILEMARFKSQQSMKKTDGTKKSRISGISKLDDANQAGTKNSSECTLILTEGDSAKTLAVSGLSVVGRDHFGVFPLRGKLLNVRDTAAAQIKNNAEITALKQIIGLQQGKVYTSTKELRYGHIMIMTDQDHDGSHIKGLIINMLDHFWPSLLKIPGFLQEFITPIVKCTPKNKGSRKKEISFYTIPEYEAWKRENEDGKGYNIKYYKGLGTSTPEDAKKYFADMAHHRKPFGAVTQEDSQLVDLAFNKKKADDRKEWLRQFQPGTFMDHSVDEITVTDFINRELILFSIADNMRSIPSAIDGMKPGQRKILYACFKRNLKNEIKVTQLAGYVSEHSAYHHGEASLFSTMIGMAQNFVGSNNLPLLEPRGQFGTRLQGGKDAASPRYIFTALNPLARVVFHPEDDALLKYLNDDGQDIEPSWYLPIIPMALVNGGEGIGTGWSCSVPNYNPRDVVQNLIRRIDGESFTTMHPWYRGFKGQIEAQAANKFKVSGIINKVNETTIEITELPLKTWTQTYKEFLEAALHGDDTKEKKVIPWIKDFKEYHTDTTVKFVVTVSEEQMKSSEEEGLEKRFKLTGSISTTNLVCFDLEGRIVKYETVNALMEDFYNLRLKYYFKRKENMLARLDFEWNKLDNRVRFILEIINGTLVVQNRKRADLLMELKRRKYFPVSRAKEAAMNGGVGAVTSRGGPVADASEEAAANEDEAEDVAAGVPSAQDYEYLLGMPIWSLTLEKVEQLKKELAAKQDEIAVLTEKTPAQLWKIDLQKFMENWDTYERELEESESVDPAKIKRLAAAASKSRKTAAKKKNEDYDDNSDSDFDDGRAKSKKTAKTTVKEEKPAAKPRAPRTKKPVVDPINPDDDDIKIEKKAADPVKTEVKAERKPAVVEPFVIDDDDDPIKPAASGLKFGYDKMDVDAIATSKPTSKPAPKPRKRVVKDDSDEEPDFNDDGSDEDVKVEPRQKAPARGGARKVVAEESDDDYGAKEEDDEDEVVIAKPKKTIAAKKAELSDDDAFGFKEKEKKPKAAPRKKAVQNASDDDVEVVATKPKATAKPAPAKAKKEPVVAAKAAISKTKKPKVLESDDEPIVNDEFGFDETPPRKKAATDRNNVSSSPVKARITDYFSAPKPAAVEDGTKKRVLSRTVVAPSGKSLGAATAASKSASGAKPIVVVDDDDDDQAAKVPAKRKLQEPVAKKVEKKAPVKKAIVDDDDDDEDDDIVNEVEEPVASRRAGRAAARKPVSYRFGGDEDDDDGDDYGEADRTGDWGGGDDSDD